MGIPILGANSASGAYEISNSLRFNDNDSPYLSRTPSSAGDRRTFTYSGWLKPAVASATSRTLIGAGANSGTNDYSIFQSGNKLRFSFATEGSGDIVTDGVFRDPAAWYHIVWAIDTTQSTASNRVKLYVNGTQETNVSGTYPDQNYQTSINNTVANVVGARSYSTTSYYDGYMADVHLIDGQALDPTYFGETNDNGVWVPKEYSGTYGTNGFKLEFQQTGTGTNSSGMGADTSGNDNHLAVNNLTSTDVTTDTPSNNFCTMNPLMSFAGASDGIDAFSEGNTVVDSNNDTSAAGSTFGVKNGKWYYEAKLTTGDQSSTNFSTGWCQVDYEGQKGTGNGVGFMSGEDNIGIDPGGNLSKNGSSTSVFGNRSTNDIFQVAVDLDNGKIHFGVNGTYSNGSATNSTTLDASNPDYSSVFDTAGVDYMPAFAQGSTGQTVLAYNFGNPAYANSSSESDDNGYGDFEYPVPSGYYSLCTKNLAEFG